VRAQGMGASYSRSCLYEFASWSRLALLLGTWQSRGYARTFFRWAWTSACALTPDCMSMRRCDSSSEEEATGAATSMRCYAGVGDQETGEAEVARTSHGLVVGRPRSARRRPDGTGRGSRTGADKGIGLEKPTGARCAVGRE
jgi:hypothetical protein